MCMSMAGLRNLKALIVNPSRNSNAWAVHRVCCGDDNFSHEACKAKPVQLPIEMSPREFWPGTEFLKP